MYKVTISNKHKIATAQQSGEILMMKMAAVTGLRYTCFKPVKQGKQHNNVKMRGDKIPTVREMGKNTLFAVQSRKKERDNGHDRGSNAKCNKKVFVIKRPTVIENLSNFKV